MGNYEMGILTLKTLEFEIKRIENFSFEEYNMKLEIFNFNKNNLNENFNENNLNEMKKELKKFMKKKRKHEKLLFISFYILLNLVLLF